MKAKDSGTKLHEDFEINKAELYQNNGVFDEDLSRIGKMQRNYMFYDPKYKDAIKKNDAKVKDKVDIYDAVANPTQSLGLGTQDLSYTGLTQVSNRGKTWQLNLIDQTMRDMPDFINGANWKAQVSTRNGIDLNSDEMDSAHINNVQSDIKKLNPEIHEEIYQGEFYGFCGGLIYIEGQDSPEDLASPLDFDFDKGSFKGIKILTRLYQIIPELNDLIGMEDLRGHKYWAKANLIGKPKYYRVYVNGSGTIEKQDGFIKVHTSRILKYHTMPLSYVESQIEMSMGVSMLERVYSDMVRYETILAQTVKMAQRSNIPVMKTDSAGSVATLNTDEALMSMYERVRRMKNAMSQSNMIQIAIDEEFSFENAQFTDLPAIIELLKENYAGSIGAPYSAIAHGKVTKDEEKAFYHIPKTIQTLNMQDWYDVLIPIVYRNRYGEDIPEFSFEFKALDLPTQKEKAETFNLVGKTIVELFDRNIFDVPSAQKMVQVAQTNVGDIANEITKEYIDYAKNGEIVNGKVKNKINIDIELGKITNQSIGRNPASDIGGDLGGNPKTTKKPTSTIKPEKE